MLSEWLSICQRGEAGKGFLSLLDVSIMEVDRADVERARQGVRRMSEHNLWQHNSCFGE
jgi:uncharacterized membrane protein YsdA (DUF1294 family)